MNELLYLPYSPWSEKARWALDLRGVSYKPRVYQPLFGEPELRMLLRRLRGAVSVPVLKTASGAIGDSFDIARFAEHAGRGPSLFPPGEEARMAEYNDLSERGLAAGRARSLGRLLESPEALIELVPKPLRPLLGAAAPKIAAAGIRRTLRKYGASRLSDQAHERALCAVLDRLRTDLARSPSTETPRTLFADLSYADLAMAQVLSFVDPPQRGLRIGPGGRRAFTDEVIRARYADLVSWRDALYARYRA